MVSDSIFTIHKFQINVEKLNETIYLIPFGDMHRFAPLCDNEKWLEFLDWAKDKPNCFYLGMGDYCLPLNTEILTREGFKKYDKLQKGEEVLGYNKDTNETEWTTLLGVYLAHNQSLINLASKSFNFTCTPNHEWFVAPPNYKRQGIRQGLISNKPRKVKTNSFKHGQRIITFAPCYEQKNRINITPNEAELLGWIVTDGHLRKNKLAASIAQSNKKYADYIFNKFGDWFSGVYEYTVGFKSFNIKTKKLREFFSRINFKTKEDLPKIVLNISFECRKAMLEAFCMAEGWKETGTWCFSQLSGPVLEAYRLLCVLTGTKISKPIVNKIGLTTHKHNKRQYVDALCLKITDVGKNDVFCPNIKLGSVVIRQNDQITITGNCDFLSFNERKAIIQAALHESSYQTIEDLMVSQTNRLVDEISFMKNRIIGFIEGNHYGMLQSGMTTTQMMCDKLSAKYLGISSFIRLSFVYGRKSASIDVWAHHGKGASRLLGGSLNTVEQMSAISDAQINLMGHDHKKSVAFKTNLYLSDGKNGVKLNQRKILLGRTGSFLKGYVDNAPSYIARAAMTPTDLGVLKIELTPKRSQKNGSDTFYLDVHCSI